MPQSDRHARNRAGIVRLLLLALFASPAAIAQQAPPVASARATTDSIVREVELTGSLSSPRWSELAPEVSGRVTKIGAEAGDRIAAGDELLRIDAALSHIDLRVAGATLREAEVNLAEARRRLREGQDLAARDSISKSELESRRADVQRLEAVVARREAERDLRAESVERHTLEAPFAGVINRRMIDLGERSDPDSPVFELVAIERLRVDLEVPQRYYGDVEPGTPVRIRVDAQPDEPIEAQIETAVPVNDPQSRTFLARVELDNEDLRLTPGMSARAILRMDTGRTGVVIPQDALIRYPDGRTVVWVIEGEGETRSVREQRIRTGLRFNGRIAVRDGLDAGATIVTEGNEALQDGQQVRVTATE